MKYTVCLGIHKTPAILFQTLDVEKIAAMPEIAALFPNGYFVTTVGERNPERYRYSYSSYDTKPETKRYTLVSTHIDTPLPDKAPLHGSDIKYFVQGTPYTLNLRQRYNHCLSLIKAVGCEHCPDKGFKCYSEEIGVEFPNGFTSAHEAEDLWDHLREHHPTIGEFTLVKPGTTRTESFSKAIRPYWEHDFDDIEKNAKRRSEAATQAAETRRFKKDQCSKCIISNSCSSARFCKGAFPPQQEILEICNDRLDRALKNSDYPEWQLWEVARNMGDEAKHSRWQIMLTGLKLEKDKLVPTVHRAKTSIDEYGNLKTYEDIAKVFKLAMTEEETKKARRGPVKDPMLRATWWLALASHRAHQTYGWGCRRYVLGVGINGSCVKVEWTNGRYISWSVSELYKISDVAKHMTYGQLGDIDKVEVR